MKLKPIWRLSLIVNSARPTDKPKGVSAALVLLTTDKQTAADLTEDKEPINEEPRRLILCTPMVD